MPTKPVRLARSTSLGGMKIRGIDGAGENVYSLIHQNKKFINSIFFSISLTLYRRFDWPLDCHVHVFFELDHHIVPLMYPEVDIVFDIQEKNLFSVVHMDFSRNVILSYSKYLL